jgi:hypothetical protein
METIDTDIQANELVSTLFEACQAFAAGADHSPVCRTCGWLEAEHEPDVAEVRSLPVGGPERLAPKRLAS